MSANAANRRWAPTSRLVLAGAFVIAILLAQFAVVSAAGVNVAGLIVDYGDGRVSYAWVPFSEEEISGVDLLERSGLDVVTVGFGGMGEAVCQIDDTGCPVGECRRRMCQTSDPESPFWRYSRQAEDGTWGLAATGASGAKVRNGDVDAWAWAGGDIDLPAMTIDEIARRAGADSVLLEDADTVPEARVRTEGDDAVGDSGGNLREQVGPALLIVALGGVAIWWARRRQVRSR